MPPKGQYAVPTSKGKEKVGNPTPRHAHFFYDDGMKHFICANHQKLFDRILQKKIWPQRHVVLGDFKEYEITTLIGRTKWVGVIEKPC